MKIRVGIAALIAAVALVSIRNAFPGGTLPKVHAQEVHTGCNLETLNGRYGLTFNGFFTRGAVPAAITAFTPVTGGGVVTFDGNGNLSASEVVSIGGQVIPVNLPGTYTVNSDCTGSFTTPAAHLNLVIVHNGREILAVNTDPGNNVLDNFVKQ
jgi:hypothetical protein